MAGVVGSLITEDLITWSLVTSLLPSPAKGSTDQTLVFVGNSLSQADQKVAAGQLINNMIIS